MPPVLDVALGELVGGRAQKVLARQLRFAIVSAITSCSWSRNPYAPPAW